ncbi:MAG: MFS transporter [Hyphomicrobiales bacterium]|nr:MFS transporter [Hyphomicrobiales bacterium]
MAFTERAYARAPFRFFLICRVVASLSYQMAGVAIGWLVYARTGSAYLLGLLGLSAFLPMVALTFVVGPVADRFDRRRIVAICEFVNVLALTTLALGANSDWLTIPTIFTAVMVLGASRAFEHPSMAALLPGIVPADTLPRSVAISSSAMQTANIVGPSLGGLLYAAGAPAPLGLAAVFSAIACATILSVAMRARLPSREPVTLASIFSGVGFIWKRPVILGAISLDLFAVLLGGVTALLPIYAQDVLHVGSLGLGLLRSAPAVGAVAMSLLVSRNIGGGVGRKMFTAVIAFGAAIVVFSLSRNFVLSLVALAVTGAADNISVVVRQSLVQLGTPDEMRGRVNAVNSLFIGTSNQLGEFESGMAAGLFGAVAAGVIGGAGTILVALLWMRIFPDLKNADQLEAKEQ